LGELLAGNHRDVIERLSLCCRNWMAVLQGRFSEDTFILMQNLWLRRGWFQEQLAELSGLSVRAFSAWSSATTFR
jgi:hypothetical protein